MNKEQSTKQNNFIHGAIEILPNWVLSLVNVYIQRYCSTMLKSYYGVMGKIKEFKKRVFNPKVV